MEMKPEKRKNYNSERGNQWVRSSCQYFSETGHTLAMAKLVAEGAAQIPGTEVRLKTIAESTLEDVIWCDGLALGRANLPGVHSVADEEMVGSRPLTNSGAKSMVNSHVHFHPRVVWEADAELTCLGLITILVNYGFLVFGATDYVAPRHTLHYGVTLPGYPKTQAEKDLCTRLGVRLGEWVAYYVDGEKNCHPKFASYPRHG